MLSKQAVPRDDDGRVDIRHCCHVLVMTWGDMGPFGIRVESPPRCWPAGINWRTNHQTTAMPFSLGSLWARITYLVVLVSAHAPRPGVLVGDIPTTSHLQSAMTRTTRISVGANHPGGASLAMCVWTGRNSSKSRAMI